MREECIAVGDRVRIHERAVGEEDARYVGRYGVVTRFSLPAGYAVVALDRVSVSDAAGSLVVYLHPESLKKVLP